MNVLCTLNLKFSEERMDTRPCRTTCVLANSSLYRNEDAFLRTLRLQQCFSPWNRHRILVTFLRYDVMIETLRPIQKKRSFNCLFLKWVQTVNINESYG